MREPLRERHTITLYHLRGGPGGEKRTLAYDAAHAAGFFQRLLGLMFRKTLGRIDALVLAPCASIHTFFMRFPIDVLCLDASGVVVDTAEKLPPWKIFIPVRPTAKIVECNPGTICKLDARPGDVVEFEKEKA